MALDQLRHKYSIGDVIGTGAFQSLYYKGYLKQNGMPVTIKVINFKLLEKEQEGVGRIEVEMLKLFKGKPDSNIIQIYDWVEHDQQLAIVLEFCQLELSDLIIRDHHQGISEQSALYLLQQMLIAVQNLHNKHIIHRDLKLDNVKLAVDGETFRLYSEKKLQLHDLLIKSKLRVSDLVVSKVVDILTDTMAGTPQTMAPEVEAGQMYGTEADIFSLGAIYYQLLTGKVFKYQPKVIAYMAYPLSIKEDYLLNQKFVSPLSYDLLTWMIGQNPKSRKTASEILQQLTTIERTPIRSKSKIRLIESKNNTIGHVPVRSTKIELKDVKTIQDQQVINPHQRHSMHDSSTNTQQTLIKNKQTSPINLNLQNQTIKPIPQQQKYQKNQALFDDFEEMNKGSQIIVEIEKTQFHESDLNHHSCQEIKVLETKKSIKLVEQIDQINNLQLNYPLEYANSELQHKSSESANIQGNESPNSNQEPQEEDNSILELINLLELLKATSQLEQQLLMATSQRQQQRENLRQCALF